MTSKSKILLLIFIFLTNTLVCISQNAGNKKVTLIEKENGKRLELYAKNTDSIGYVVFLRVTTTDYRRTSKRPVLKPIAPNSEVHLLTLIKLVGSGGEYTPHFIVNEMSANIAYRKDDEGIQVNFDNALKTANIIIYESDTCNFCEDTKTLFNKNKIAFKTKPILDNVLQLTKKLKKQNLPTENLNNESFMLQIESDIYRGITNKKELLDVLKKYIE